MEVYLSNLLDLSLGTPHGLECENFNFLHTLLHVILKKTDLSECRVELTDELAEKAQSLMLLMPTEPSICFKEVSESFGKRSNLKNFFSSVHHQKRRLKAVEEKLEGNLHPTIAHADPQEMAEVLLIEGHVVVSETEQLEPSEDLQQGLFERLGFER